MLRSPSAPYVLRYQARSLVGLAGSTDVTRFAVGTCRTRGANELHVVEFSEQRNELLCRALYAHPAEVVQLAACPNSATVVASVYPAVPGGPNKASLWRLRGLDKGGPLHPTESTPTALDPPLCDLSPPATDSPAPPSTPSSPAPAGSSSSTGAGNSVRSVFWETGTESESHNLVVIDETGFRALRLDGGSQTSCQATCTALLPRLTAGAWDPHKTSGHLALVQESNIRCWDLRANKAGVSIEAAHSPHVRDLDFNPNRPYFLASVGDDAKLKFWDVRATKEPQLALNAHQHWAWRVMYNRYHDQLLVTSSTDRRVGLWKVASLSSSSRAFAATSTVEDEQAADKDPDGLIEMYDDFEDSVYSVAWSACDAWVFASLCYEGSVVVNHVPSAERYKIIL
eukprot:gnl/Hemi2/20100_TR6662_c0_g1_i1.p1 gnl/Hemi2/20100_TR6662_c0_g1~~gnl/Hemi2/20100_TR6662_c0_g1_i1.p1  ORF type:complete len:398 (-),score=125.41 gnl/Hemi2/20100_TR6662_c0_g1_i1:45-1238(-)